MPDFSGPLNHTATTITAVAAILLALSVIWRKGIQPLRRAKRKAVEVAEVILALPRKHDELAAETKRVAERVSQETRERAERLYAEAKERYDRISAVSEDFRLEALDRFNRQDRLLQELAPNGGGSIRDTVSKIDGKVEQLIAEWKQHQQTCELIVLGGMVGGQRRTDPQPSLRELVDEATPPTEQP